MTTKSLNHIPTLIERLEALKKYSVDNALGSYYREGIDHCIAELRQFASDEKTVEAVARKFSDDFDKLHSMTKAQLRESATAALSVIGGGE
jgi:hypothetical protein